MTTEPKPLPPGRREEIKALLAKAPNTWPLPTSYTFDVWVSRTLDAAHELLSALDDAALTSTAQAAAERDASVRAHALDQFADEVVAWADATFSQSTDNDRTEHLIEEAEELQDAPDDAHEAADVFLILLNHTRRKGIDLLAVAREKFEIVKARATNRKARRVRKKDAEIATLKGTVADLEEQLTEYRRVDDRPQPIGKCPRCGTPVYTDMGYCGVCEGRG